MFTSLSTREKRLLAATVIVLVGALCYRAIYYPQVSRLLELHDEAVVLRLKLTETRRALALSDRIERQYRRYEEAIASAGTLMEEMIDFQRTVSDLTDANEMETTEVRSSPVSVSQYYRVLSMPLTVKTRPVWLARFLAQLESGGELIRVRDVSVRAIDENENLSVDMKLTRVVAAQGGEE